jgi:GR25 family glycosyltransferase involved in LPS biosynthesis
MKICFATDVNYPNYTKRIQKNTLKEFLDRKLYEYDISYYISTNRPQDLIKYDGINNVRIFDTNELRSSHDYSLKYELLPEDPTGIYPARYPWNLRRFVVEQAAKDGFDYIIYVDGDTVFHKHVSTEGIVETIIRNYEANTVKTNAAVFYYSKESTSEVFHLHERYFNVLNRKFTDDELNTMDGPCMIFIGETPEKILGLTKIWHKFAEFGYKKEFGFGYESNFHGNLSFTIPLSGFRVKSESYPFFPDHVSEDRYTYGNNNFIAEDEDLELFIENVSTDDSSIEFNLPEQNNISIDIIEDDIFSIPENKEISPEESIFNTPINFSVTNEIVGDENSITNCMLKYASDKVSSKYTTIYEQLFSPLKNEKLIIVEVGVGTISKTPLEGMSHVPSTMYGWKERNMKYEPGASLRGLRDYFVNSEIIGIDIQPDCLIEEDRIKTYLFDSTDSVKANELFEDESLDILIDDGNHDPDFQIKTLINFYKKIKNDGLYIIEDVVNKDKVCSYLDENDLNYRFYDVNVIIIFKKKNREFSEPTMSIEFKKPEITELKPAIEPINFINEDKEFKINGIKFADRGFFINLDSSTDRLRLVVNQIKKYNIEGLNRFIALTDEWRHFSCTKSHLKVFETSLLEDYEIIFVSEDDFMIEDLCYYPNGKPQRFFDVLEKVRNDLDTVEWDVLTFGCNPKGPLIPITDNLAIANKSTGAWAYLIKKKAYRYLLKNSNYKKDVTAIDDWLPLLNDKGFITLTTIPLTINHGIGLVSTLQPAGPVNYDGWIKGSYHKFLYDLYPNNNFTNNLIEKDLTVVIVGHFVENSIFYLNYLLHSLPNVLNKCKILVHYDEQGFDVNTQKIKLSAYFRDNRPNLNVSISFSNGGLISSIDNLIEKIKTPYFLFLEHDWVFLNKTNIDFPSLLTAFNNHNFINAVWFSKDDNQMRGFEIADDITGKITPFELESRVNECNIITSCRWSNNPAIFRTTKMKEWFYNIIKNDHVGTVHQGCHNVEETMIPYYRNVIKENLWEDIKDEWGTYLYGNLGEGPYVGHTDASKRYQGQNKSQPEINGEEYIKNNPL